MTLSETSKFESTSLSHDYWEETTKGVANVLSALRATWYADPRQYRWERHQLEKYVTPLHYGAGSAIFLFATFRIAGNPRFQAWRKNLISERRRRSESQLSSTNPRTGIAKSEPGGGRRPSHPAPPMGYLESKREREVQAALSSMRIITDVLVSVSTGTSGALLLLQAHHDTMRKDFEQAPLVSGRSVVADEICPPFLHIAESYKKKNPDVKPNDTDDVNLRSFAKFTENCSRRRDLESRIRTERKLPLDTPVPIPLLALERYRC